MKIIALILIIPFLSAGMIFSKNAVEGTKCTNAASKEYAATNTALKTEHDSIGTKVGHARKRHQTAVERFTEAKKKKAESKSNAHDKDIARFERLVKDTAASLKPLEAEFVKANKKYRDGTDAARKKLDAANVACRKK